MNFIWPVRNVTQIKCILQSSTTKKNSCYNLKLNTYSFLKGLHEQDMIVAFMATLNDCYNICCGLCQISQIFS